MGGDNERSEAGTAPAWLSRQHQQEGDAGSESTAFAATTSSSSSSSSAFSGARKKPGPASVGLPSRCMSAIEAHSSGVNDVVFEKGGVLLATAGDDSYVKVWEPGSGRQRAVLKVRCGVTKTCDKSCDALVPCLRLGFGSIVRSVQTCAFPCGILL